METIRIIIADQAFLVREGIKAVVSVHPYLQIVGEARHQAELIELTQQERPNVVILDYRATEAFSTENVATITEVSPGTSVLVISSDLEKTQVLKVLEYGALGFLLKECDETEILGAIHAVSKGEKFFCSKVLDILLERTIGGNNDDCAPTRLTIREIDIVRLMAKGLTAQEIADKLTLSIHTVYTHRKNIMRKLGASSASEVVRYAFQTALV